MNHTHHLLSRAVVTFLTITCTTLHATAEIPTLALELISGNQIASPVAITNANDGSNRLFVVNQRGTVDIIQDGQVLPTPFIDLNSLLIPKRQGFDERGLLSIAFHPEFATPASPHNGKFYAYYSATSPNASSDPNAPVDHMSVVSEFKVSNNNPNLADISSQRILMTVDQPQFNHDGGQLAFGPDNKLYISLGDGGGSNDNREGHTGGNENQPNGPTVLGNSQDRTNLLGSILRIDVNGNNSPNGQYGIPADNPFATEGNGVRPEIYAYGLRNPWRFSFDDGTPQNPGTGELFVADVGQGKVEEVNKVISGGNYGWRITEGTLPFDPSVNNPNPGPLLPPIAQYTRPSLEGDPSVENLQKIGVTVVGGIVYRGSQIPGLNGTYVFADWSQGFFPPNGTLLGLEPGNTNITIFDLATGNPLDIYINAIGEDESGEIYVIGRTALDASGLDNQGQPTGFIYKLVAVPEPTSLAALLILSLGLINRRKPSKA